MSVIAIATFIALSIQVYNPDATGPGEFPGAWRKAYSQKWEASYRAIWIQQKYMVTIRLNCWKAPNKTCTVMIYSRNEIDQ